MIPAAKPKIKKDAAIALLKRHKVSNPVCLIGIRGYYAKMGPTPGNDRALFDDALILVSSGGDTYATFNANVDPTLRGHNPKVGKGYASLKPGVYSYKLGLHGLRTKNPYKALVQAGPVTVVRDCGKEETGWFGINIHAAGRTTSSEGCQTVPRANGQYDALIALVESELKRNNAKTVTYILTANQ